MKSVHVVDPKRFDHSVVKALYFDAQNQSLKPDFCMVDPDGEFLWQTNAMRLRGPDVQPGTKIGVVWGDSVVFCVYQRSWPEMLADFKEGWVFLNGGIEGIDYVKVLERAIDFNASYKVEANIILPGWESIGMNSGLANDLRAALKSIPNAALSTMPTSLNATMIDSDIKDAFVFEGDDETRFRFLGRYEYSVRLQQMLFAHICERNAIVRAVASETGTPLIDLFSALDSSRMSDFRECFFDLSHPRPSAYRKIASIMWEAIEPITSR